MKLLRNTVGVVTALVLMGAIPPAWAQMAVVDVGAIAQLIEQVETARSHLEQALNGMAGDYSALAGQLAALVVANAVLTPEQLAHTSDQEREQLEAARRSAALLQATSRQALEATSERFEALQDLINAIPGAEDQKAVLDLQARIGAEQAMLQNEHTKLMVLYQAAQAEEVARRQRASELAIANIGSLRRLPALGLNE